MRNLKKIVDQLFGVALTSSHLILWCLAVTASIPRISVAQEQVLQYGSMQAWEENLWLFFLDRNDSFQGRLSEKGILKRFTPLVDSKYQLDVLGSQFNPLDDSRWNETANGVRWRGTSATTLLLTSFAEFKTSVDLGGPWTMNALFNQTTDRGFEGSAIRLQFARTLGRSAKIFSGVHLDPHKAGGDFWIGTEWDKGPNRVTSQLTILDPLNNFLHVTLDASLHPHGDTTVVYTQQPVAIRLADHLNLNDNLRIEAYAMLMPTARLDISSRKGEHGGFTLGESARYLGGLIEWTPTKRLLLAGSITEVDTDSDRIIKNTLRTNPNQELLEMTREITGFTIFRPNRHWSFSATAVKKTMMEKRTLHQASTSNVDYLLKIKMGKLAVAYSNPNGFITRTSLLHSNSEVPKGVGEMNVTNYLAGKFYRFLLNLGWEFDNSSISIGSAYDYQSGQTPSWIWGTASGQFSMYW